MIFNPYFSESQCGSSLGVEHAFVVHKSKMKCEVRLALAATIKTAEEKFADLLFNILQEQLHR